MDEEALKSHMMLSFSGWEKKPTHSKLFAMLTPNSVAELIQFQFTMPKTK